MNPVVTLEPGVTPGAEANLAAWTAQNPPKPRVWTVFAAFAAAVVVGEALTIGGQVVANFICGFVLGIQGVEPAAMQPRMAEMLQHPMLAVILSLVPFQIGMVLVAAVAAWQSCQPIGPQLGLVRPELGGRRWLAIGSLSLFTLAAAYAVLIASSLLLSLTTPQGASDSVVEDGAWYLVTALSMLISILPGIAEEVLFRGYIQQRLLKRRSPQMAIGVTAVLFAALHYNSLQHILAVLPLGLVLGILAYRTGSIVPGILVHVLHNVMTIAVGVISTRTFLADNDTAGGIFICSLVGVFAIASLPAMIWLLRRRPAVAAAAPPVVAQGVALE